jgi:hypothetical protein
MVGIVQRYDAITLTCATCRQTFVWTGGEQRFYAEHEFTAPRHCPRCRQSRRDARAARETASGVTKIPGAA